MNLKETGKDSQAIKMSLQEIGKWFLCTVSALELAKSGTFPPANAREAPMVEKILKDSAATSRTLWTGR